MSMTKRLVRFFWFVPRNSLGKMTKPFIQWNLPMKPLTIWKEDYVHYIDNSPETIRESIGRLIPGRGFDECLPQALEKQIDKLASEMWDVTRDILFTTGDERTLMDQQSAIDKALFATNLNINHLRQEQTKF